MKRCAAALLPLPMPPIGSGHLTTPEQRDPARNGQIGPKRNWRACLLVAQAQQHQAQQRAHQRGQQQRQRQDLPAAPGAEHGQQLEIAIAHALLAGDQLEQPVHRPQAQVAGHGAPQ
uniref:Secreted protein n=1 Tax=Steinernema glaseri TaxID=37863 RepID=A0A1I8ALD1_9BILA